MYQPARSIQLEKLQGETRCITQKPRGRGALKTQNVYSRSSPFQRRDAREWIQSSSYNTYDAIWLQPFDNEMLFATSERRRLWKARCAGARAP